MITDDQMRSPTKRIYWRYASVTFKGKKCFE